MKREKQFCAVWMEKKHEWSLEEKKSLQRYIQERKKKIKKKMNNCEISLKDKQKPV